MVSSLSIAFMIFSALVSILVPVSLFIYSRKKYNISIKTVGIGILTFIIFSQILEKAMHVVVISNNLIGTTTIAFAIYGALAAGVFEEVGRFISMKFFLKGELEWKDGLAFGIGHGGIEAVLIGVVSNAQNLVLVNLINGNGFNNLLNAATTPAAKQSLETVRSSLINTAPTLFAVGGIERIFAIIIHLAGSILVLYAVKNKKVLYLFIAIFGHALIDFFPALYQIGRLGIAETEIVVALSAIALLFFVIKSKRIFEIQD